MLNILLFVHVLVCLALIGLVLIQRGKGADVGAAFGSGASNTVFGSSGAGDFLSKATTWLAALFFVLALSMTYLTNNALHTSGVLEAIPGGPADQASGASLPSIPE